MARNRTGSAGAFREIADELRRRIREGVLQPREQLDSQNALAEEFGVCQATMQKALKELEREKLLHCRRGKGRFVADWAIRTRTQSIGVVLFDFAHVSHPLMTQRLAGIQATLGRAGYHLSLYAINDRGCLPNDSDERWLGVVDPHALDGALIVAQEAELDKVRELGRHIPVVWFDVPPSQGVTASVRMDYLGGAFAAAQHLLDLGHRRLSLITPAETFNVAREQRDGLRLALRGHSGASAQVLTAEGFSEQEGIRLTRELLELSTRPTGLICGSDELALGAYQALTAAGMQVPQDISVVAWNDTLTAEQLPVAPTTVRLDVKQAGAVAAEKLLAAIETPASQLESVCLDAELVVRDSTAIPPHARDSLSA